jgi:hypothetical protein
MTQIKCVLLLAFALLAVPWGRLVPGHTQLRRSWRTLTEFIWGYSRYPRVGNPGLKLANAFGVRLLCKALP